MAIILRSGLGDWRDYDNSLSARSPAGDELPATTANWINTSRSWEGVSLPRPMQVRHYGLVLNFQLVCQYYLHRLRLDWLSYVVGARPVYVANVDDLRFFLRWQFLSLRPGSEGDGGIVSKGGCDTSSEGTAPSAPAVGPPSAKSRRQDHNSMIIHMA